MNRLVGPVLVAAVVAVPAAAHAQSLLGAGGLGVPIEALDARARGMGSVGVGLFGASVLPGDPAAVLDVPLPIVTATMQPTTGTIRQGDVESDLSTLRFPLVGIAYPVTENAMLTLTAGGFLDQRWSASVGRTVNLGGNPVAVTDRFESDGGISTLQIGLARSVGERFGIAVSGGLNTGLLRRTFTRQYDTTAVGDEIGDFRVEGSWQQRGPTVTVGVTVDPLDLVRLAASATWSGRLDAEPRDDTPGEGESFDLPLQLRAGASGALTPRLSATLGVAFADWTETGKGLVSGGEAGMAWSMGGGLEWDGFRWIGRDFPVRLGYRRSELPFRFSGDDPTETAVSGGLGLQLAQIEDIPLARMDIALERGERSGGAVTERFWRATFSLRVSGR